MDSTEEKLDTSISYNQENTMIMGVYALEHNNFAAPRGDGWYSEVYDTAGYADPVDMKVDDAQYKIGEPSALGEPNVFMRSSSSDDYLKQSIKDGEIVTEPRDKQDFNDWYSEQHNDSLYHINHEPTEQDYKDYAQSSASSMREITIDNPYGNPFEAAQVSPYLTAGIKEYEPEAFHGVDLPEIPEGSPECRGASNPRSRKPSEYGDEYKSVLKENGVDVDTILEDTKGVYINDSSEISQQDTSGEIADTYKQFVNGEISSDDFSDKMHDVVEDDKSSADKSQATPQSAEEFFKGKSDAAQLQGNNGLSGVGATYQQALVAELAVLFNKLEAAFMDTPSKGSSSLEETNTKSVQSERESVDMSTIDAQSGIANEQQLLV